MQQPKPKILIFPFELLSHYSRCIQLAQTIQDEYDILFCRSNKYAEFVEQAGFSTFPCEIFDASEVMDCSRKFDFSWLNYDDIYRVVHKQISVIQDFEPVAVIGDTAPTLRMASEVTKVPYINLMNGYMTRYYKNVRKIARAHPAADYEEKVPSNVFEFMIKAGEFVAFKHVHRPFKKVRKKLGLKRKGMYLEELEGDSNLICDLPEFFPQENLPDNYKFIGPLFFSGKKEEPEVLKFMNNGKPNVLISMGSTGDFSKLKMLSEASFSKYNIIVAGEADGVFNAQHILVKPFINNAAILDKIDVMICHGGNGTIYQALAFGVPLLFMTSIFEQEWNVQQAASLGYGEDIFGVESAEEIHALIEKWRVRKCEPKFLEIKEKVRLDKTKEGFKKIWAQN